MASLNTLKNKFGFVISILLGAVLVIFALNLDSGSLMGGPSREEMMGHTVLEIDGTAVKYAEYAERSGYIADVYRNVPQTTEDNVANLTASLFIYDIFAAPALEELGLSISESEMNEFARNVGQQTASMYSYFPADYLNNIIAANWAIASITAEQEMATEKFGSVMAAADYVNRLEVEQALRRENTTFDGSYVMVPYTALESVEVSDAEIEEYYQAHRQENEDYGTRSIRYVSFPIQASEEDRAAIEADVMAAYENIVNAGTDVEAIKREVRAVGGRVNNYVLYSSLPAATKSAVDAGTQAPTVVNNTWTGYYVISDVEAPATFGFEVVEADNVIEAEAIAEQLIAVGGDFTQLEEAVDYTTATRSMTDMGNVDASNYIGRNVGDIFVHTYNNKPAVIKITELGDVDRYVAVANLSVAIEASEATKREVLSNSGEFLVDAGNSIDTFRAAADAASYTMNSANVNRNDFNPQFSQSRGVNGIANSRNIALWAYNAEVGAIKSFHGENVIHVVLVEAVDNNRYEPKDENAIRRILTQQKQYEAIKGQLALDCELEGVESGSFTGVKFADTVIDGRNEAALIGAITSTTDADLNQPITVRGQRGAYLFVVENIDDSNVDLESIDTERIPMMTQRESELAQVGFMVLVSKADIEDHRGEGDM